MSLKLKTVSPSSLPPIDPSCTSSHIHASSIPVSSDQRDHYLGDTSLVPPPLVSCSSFVPRPLVEHLMRNKKHMAINVKFSPWSGCDQITNMEGALHTFVTPVIPRCEMVGDYLYRNGHGVAYFGPTADKFGKRVKFTRSVVLSASIQLDFETEAVMVAASKLGNEEVVGENLLERDFEILSVESKQITEERERYDAALKAHMVYHLISSHSLPSKKHVKTQDKLPSNVTIALLEDLICKPDDPAKALQGKFLERGSTLLSLELLYSAAVQQAINELSALEALCPQGYIYSYDPASIFAREIGSKILNRLMLAAVRSLSAHNIFTNMKIFGFNEYADPGVMSLVHKALKEQVHVRVLRKDDLFQGKGKLFDVSKYGHEVAGAMLVVHNNSDAFGQNVETEGMGGSLDGAVGASSSAAASLKRDREDLVDFVC